ncbi:ubiquitin carboxyl-terminal hydrolase 30 homolog [Tetranychus urticae]|uniref:Ubiquitin carboxyl-terminal hydrolase n=1 Tax=Tetranychus urticae TaxID=32264 RepID=T1K054_TETUR|nr:ubiquitin carboxyl-terminal hydrolase 30 homolog [Tetranychus urticae]
MMLDQGITGLINFGSQCFVNAVLQSLAGCKSIVNWLQYSSKLNDQWLTRLHAIHSTNGYTKENKLTSSLLSTIQSINQQNSQNASPIDVLNALRYHRWRIPNEEQDAHELFNALTTTLESELYSSMPVYSLRDAIIVEELVTNGFTNKSTPRITTRGSQDAFTLNNRFIPRPLPTKGLLASQLQCTQCGYKYPVHLEGFYSVSLAMPNSLMTGISSLKECLNKFVSNEIIQNVRCEECSKIGENPNFVKRLTFAKLPQILCIHFHRLMWHPNGITIKKSDHVTFPEYLTMDDYVYQRRTLKSPKKNNLDHIGGAFLGSYVTPYPQTSSPLCQNILLGQNAKRPLGSNHSKYRYRLVATIVHIGDSQSGHFVTYRRSTGREGQWYLTSDTVVRPAHLTEVLSKPAYMLFYERLKE